jgi:hypothetical protein
VIDPDQGGGLAPQDDDPLVEARAVLSGRVEAPPPVGTDPDLPRLDREAFGS